MWLAVQCSRLSCSKFQVVKDGTMTKKCPYCGRRFKVEGNVVKKFPDQLHTRVYVKKMNKKYGRN